MRSAIVFGLLWAVTAAGLCAETPKSSPTDRMTLDLGNGVKLELVRIKAGSFQMGMEGGDGDEKPIHAVTLSKDFYMAKYVTTQEQWEAVMGANPSNFKGAKLPAEGMTWNDTQTFFQKLKDKTNVDAALPTKAQWEYACRAGSSTKYSGGNDESNLAEAGWYDKNSDEKTHEVGGKKPNAWGLYDMHGNVWEWCKDWYDPDFFKRSDSINPENTTPSESRVLRGGAWDGDAGDCRSGKRQSDCGPGCNSSHSGFRMVVPAKNP